MYMSPRERYKLAKHYNRLYWLEELLPIGVSVITSVITALVILWLTK